MSSDDVLENADFAFGYPELVLFEERERAEFSRLVGQTLRRFSRRWGKQPEPPLSDFQVELVARAAEVFTRRFEVLGHRKQVRPDESDSITSAVIEQFFRHQTVVWRGRAVNLEDKEVVWLASVAGTVEKVVQLPDRIRGFTTPDHFRRAQTWLAAAVNFPGLLEWTTRRSAQLSAENWQRWRQSELPRWLSPHPPVWFQPERLLAISQFWRELLEYFSQQAIQIDQKAETQFIADIQSDVLGRLAQPDGYSLNQRHRLEKLYFELEQRLSLLR